jgi:hypothetical protein
MKEVRYIKFTIHTTELGDGERKDETYEVSFSRPEKTAALLEDDQASLGGFLRKLCGYVR